MNDREQIAALKQELAKLQNHNVMIVEANKRLAMLVAEYAAKVRDAENNTLRMLVTATRGES